MSFKEIYETQEMSMRVRLNNRNKVLLFILLWKTQNSLKVDYYNQKFAKFIYLNNKTAPFLTISSIQHTPIL